MFCGTLKMPFSIIRAVNRSYFLQHVQSRSFSKQISISISRVKALSGVPRGPIWSPRVNAGSLNLLARKTTSNSTDCKLHTSASLFSNGNSNAVVVYTDASEIANAAGYWENNGAWFRYPWDSANPGIAWMEFFAIIIAARRWGSQWQNRSVNFKTDSLAAVDAWNDGRFRANYMNVLRKDLELVRNHYSFSVHLSHIRSDENLVDALSRNNLEEFLAKNPTAIKGPLGPFPDNILRDLKIVRERCNLPGSESG